MDEFIQPVIVQRLRLLLSA